MEVKNRGQRESFPYRRPVNNDYIIDLSCAADNDDTTAPET